jgi:hypothetical protein
MAPPIASSLDTRTNPQTDRMKQKRSISLRLSHPAIAPAAIVKHIGRTPRFSWGVGEKRRTPKGTLLTGIRKETYCCFQLPVHGRSLADDVERILVHDLARQKRFFREFVTTGGEIELYVTWETGTTTGEEFAWRTLARMADLRINLSVEWFVV